MADQDRPQIYLITPPELDLDTWPDQLAAVLDSAETVSYTHLTLPTILRV